MAFERCAEKARRRGIGDLRNARRASTAVARLAQEAMRRQLEASWRDSADRTASLAGDAFF